MECNLKKDFKCDFCYKAFARKSVLTRHKQIHTGEKPYKCEICSKAFACKSRLNQHKLIHTGEKPFKCELCSKAFKQKCSLDLHKLIHYKCELCFKAFTNKCNLDDHKRIHTSEKPFKCELWPKSFTEKVTLIRNERIHISEKTHNISCATSSKKVILKKRSLSEDSSTSIQEVSTQRGKIEHKNKTEHLINIQSICSQLNDYRMKHMLTPEELFKDIKLWQVQDGAMANRSMHPLKTEDYPQFLSICNNDIRESIVQVSPNLMASPLWTTIQCFLSNIYNDNTSATSIDNYQSNQTSETGNNLNEKMKYVTNCFLEADKRKNSEKTWKDLTNIRVKEEKRNPNFDTGCSFQSYDELGTHLEESQLITEKEKEFHESSAKSLFGENVEPFFLKSEVILPDEEDGNDWKSQNMSEILTSNNELGCLDKTKKGSHQENAEPFFLKSEVILSDEEDSHNWKSQDEILASNNAENKKEEKKTSTTCISTSNGEESAEKDLVTKIVGKNDLDSSS